MDYLALALAVAGVFCSLRAYRAAERAQNWAILAGVEAKEAARLAAEAARLQKEYAARLGDHNAR